jgi:hypothetical protein
MPAALLVPTLDHVVVNVRDQLDAAAERYRRLGFTLTPRGYHTLGSMNHLAIFGTEYLELIAAPAGETRRPEIVNGPMGLNGLVFGSEDAVATHSAMTEAGVRVEPWEEFSRPVELADGPQDAVFRTVRLTPGTVPAGRLYFCQHFTRGLVWRDEWRHHPNGVVGVAAAVIAAADPDDLGGLFRRMFGGEAVRTVPGGVSLTVGLSRFDVLSPEGVAALFGDAAPDGGGRATYMAGLLLRTRSLAAVEAALAAGEVAGTRQDGGRIVVPASAAFGAVLVFGE